MKLKDAANAINHGGCLLYVMDSTKVPLGQRVSGKKTLRFLAENSGGRYFSGRDKQKMVRQLKGSTGAYYELYFSQDIISDRKKSVQVRLKPRKKGIRLFTLDRTEFKIPYRRMEERQMKLFALNVVQKGSWSRIVGRIGYYKRYSVLEKKHRWKRVELTLPKDLRNRQLDVFVINLNPKSFKADIRLSKKAVGDRIQVEIDVMKKRKQYLVLVEPERTLCVYTEIR